MKYILNIIRFILIIVITACVAGLIISNIASSTIFSKNYILSKLEETEYYSSTYKKINSNFENYIGPSGLDEEIFKNIITENKVKEDTIKIIDNIYENKNQTIEIDEIKTNLYNNIDKNLGRTLTVTEQKAIEQYVNKIVEEYNKTILNTSEYQQQIADILNKVDETLPNINKVLIIISIVLLLILLALSYKNVFKGISNVGITLISNGILFIVINNYINAKIKIQNIIILNESISNTIKIIAKDILNSLIKNGVLLLLCGILIILISNSLKVIKEKNREENFD